MEPDELDVVVVGMGPAGLFATYYARLRGLDVGVIDVLPKAGGQVAELLPDKPIYDVAGHPVVRGRELIAALTEQVGFEPAISLHGHAVTHIERSGSNWRIRTDRNAELQTRTIVFCTGAGQFRPRTLPGAANYLGRGVSYAPPNDVRVGPCVVVGGGDSALDAALALEGIAESVVLVHRSSRFRAHEGTVARLERSAVQQRLSSEIIACAGDGHLERVTCQDRNGNTEVLPADHLTVALGLIARPAPFADWGIETVSGRIRVGSNMQTSQPGIFAAGDAVTYPGKVPLIASGFGEAATAVNNAAAVARSELYIDPGHSSMQPPRMPNSETEQTDQKGSS